MKYFFVIGIAILVSCSAFSDGYYDSNNQYFPKRPSFTLKDKEGFYKPTNLSIEAIYKLDSKFYRGTQSYPISPESDNPQFSPLYNTDIYMKFLPNGRCYSFSKKQHDQSGNPIALQRSDLAFDRAYTSKAYYYPISHEKISIESFVPGQGDGRYIIKEAMIMADGNQLKVVYKNMDAGSYDIYTLEEVPESWNFGTVDW